MAKGKPGRPKKIENQAQNIEQEEEKKKEDDVKVEETPKPKQRKTRKQIDRRALIPCRSLVYGGLIFKSKKTGAHIVWENYGIVEDVEYQDLQAMKASGSKFLKVPWIVPEDDEVIETLRLQGVYNNIIDLEDLNSFFKLSKDEMIKKIDSIPEGMKELLKSKAVSMIKNEELNDIRIIRMLDKKLNSGLMELLD